MSKRTLVKSTVKNVKKFCASCLKPIDPEYAVETEVGLKHQSCFRKCI